MGGPGWESDCRDKVRLLPLATRVSFWESFGKEKKILFIISLVSVNGNKFCGRVFYMILSLIWCRCHIFISL